MSVRTSSQSWCLRVEDGRARCRCKLNIPVINTYSKQITDCNKMYKQLLNDHPSWNNVTRTTPFPGVRRMHTGTSGYRSAPPWCGRRNDNMRITPVSTDTAIERGSRASTTRDSRPSTQGVNPKYDPIRLSNYLKSRGFGSPVLITSSNFEENEKTLPPGVRARVLPKNPSLREKVKGRARLDYEMANIKAEAFCEQEKERYFRTASANMRNRDIRFQEEELREQIRREQGDEEDDDVISIVASPLNREELFCRIESWIQEVESAIGESVQSE